MPAAVAAAPAPPVVRAHPHTAPIPPAAVWAPPAPSGELLPPATPIGREQRRRSRRRRGLLLGIGAAGLAAVVAVAGVTVLSRRDDPADSAQSGVRTANRRVRTSTTSRAARSTTTTTGGTAPAPAGAAATAGAGSATPPARSPATATPPATGSAGPDPEADPNAYLQVSMDAGSCRWDGDNWLLLSSGTIRSTSGVDLTADLTVSWVDATGDLDSWDELVDVPAGATVPYDVSTDWADAPQGLTCHAELNS